MVPPILKSEVFAQLTIFHFLFLVQLSVCLKFVFHHSTSRLFFPLLRTAFGFSSPYLLLFFLIRTLYQLNVQLHHSSYPKTEGRHEMYFPPLGGLITPLCPAKSFMSGAVYLCAWEKYFSRSNAMSFWTSTLQTDMKADRRDPPNLFC